MNARVDNVGTENEHKGTMTLRSTTVDAYQRPSVAGYTKALEDAGVRHEDLRLLRELAEINAHELSQPLDHVRPSRVFL